MKKLARGVPLLAIAGLGTSAFLLWAYLTGSDAACHAGCEEVRQSPYAHLLGLPTPGWGIIFYLVILVLSLWWNRLTRTAPQRSAIDPFSEGGWAASRSPADRREVLGWSILTLAGVGLFASASLTYVEVFVVRALCPWCLGSAAASFLIFLLALVHLFERPVIEIDRVVLAHLGVFFVAFLSILVGIAQVSPPPKLVQRREAENAEPERADPKVLYSHVRHTQGPEDAPIKLVEFVDFQCSTCAAVATDLHRLLQTHPGKIRVIVRQFPLQMHAYSGLAAEAAEAAGAQGKFWEMYYELLEKQDEIWTQAGRKEKQAREALKRLAQTLGLNVRKFQADLDSHKFRPVIEQDIKDGRAIGVTGTPTVYLNERRLPSTITLTEVIEQHLAELKGKGSPAQGSEAAGTGPTGAPQSGHPTAPRAGVPPAPRVPQSGKPSTAAR